MRYVGVVVALLMSVAFADFNRTSGLVDIPKATTLPHLGFRAGIDGAYNLSTNDSDEDIDQNFHLSLGLFDRLEPYLNIYTIDNITATAGFCHNLYKSSKLAFAWGVHEISYSRDVSEAGRGDSIGYFDDMMYDQADYEKPFELGSAFVVSTYAMYDNIDITIGLGRGRYVGYGTHSKYFNSNLYHEQGGDWGIGLFAGMEARLGDHVKFLLDGDGRDINVGFGFRYSLIELQVALTKAEWYIWRDDIHAPSISAAMSIVQDKERPKRGVIAGRVLDIDGNALVAEVGFATARYSQEMTELGSGHYAFDDIKSGTYEMYALSEGFDVSTKKVKVHSGRTTYCDFSLKPKTESSGQIVGKVTDFESSNPLVVDLTVVETDARTTSDSDGMFEFSDLPPGVYRVMAQTVGYEIGFYPIEVPAGKRAMLDIRMLKPLTSIILKGIKFDFGKATILSESYSILDDAAAVITNHPDMRIEIQGHTDAVGSAANNMKLSYLRASAVRDYLFTMHDIDPSRLIPMGYGESRPIASNMTLDGRALNRRVEFLILK